MSALIMSSMPSLLMPKRLTPLKKPRKGRKSRRAAQRTRAAAEDETKSPASPTTAGAAKGSSVPETSSTPPPPKSPPAASTSSVASTAKTVGSRLLGSMTIRGGAPELIIGRAAMIAIPSVIAYEMIRQEEFLQLIMHHKVMFLGVMGLLTLASLIPIARGAKYEDFGFMTTHAELINGRAAMIGILAILVLEAKSGTNFF